MKSNLPKMSGTMFIALFSFKVFAQQPLPQASVGTHLSPAPECKQQLNDPFELGAKASQGLDAGKCIKQNHRAVVILSEIEKRRLNIPSKPGYVTIGNLQHTDGFYIANIPMNSAYESRFLVEHFILGKNTPFEMDPGHAMMRVLFASDVELYKQDERSTAFAFTTRDLVFSVESSTKFNGDLPSIQRIVDGSFALTSSVFTLPKRFERNRQGEFNKVEQWKTKMDAEKARLFIAKYLDNGERGTRKSYLVQSQNCASELFRIVDTMFTYNSDQLAQISATSEGEWVPSFAPASMQARGIISIDEDKLPDVNAEFPQD